MNSPAIDAANAAFWDELCGSSFARALGIADRSAVSLETFDRAYLDHYPYLLRHVPVHTMRGQAVLEIGLGYGTLSQQIAEAGAAYTGLDIAAGPVDMVNHRLRMAGLPGKAVQGSVLECPLPDASMDCVASIGCFHHTGNLQRCIDETFRVLKPGGRAFIMVYNRFSYRQWLRWPGATLAAALGRPDAIVDAQRQAYDPNIAGDGAPETVFTSAADLRAMFRQFSQCSLTRENCEHPTLRGLARCFVSNDTLTRFEQLKGVSLRKWPLVPRRLLLGNLGRAIGLDLYATATK